MQKNHYESAFEAFLRISNIPYFSNRQDFRNRFKNGSSLKNFDFVISLPQQGNWIVDVKGRKFPGGSNKRHWKHWTTRDDLSGLLKWEKMLGDQFRGLFVFAYQICDDISPLPVENLFAWKKQLYAFIGVELHQYLGEVRLISPQWQTYEMPIRRFKTVARPFTDFISPEWFQKSKTNIP
ncbi:MAG: HYExAFE family protein [Planctomycetia bacterium]|nr:HYExAFE family protein [Planctomycetia bacterium]